MSGSETGFGTTSTLSVELDERSLTNVKHQIQSEIGSMPLGVTDGGSMSAQMAGGAGSGRERRRRRREFRWARERTGYLEDAVTYLEEIEDKVGDDDGGIAGGIINQVIDSGGDAGGAAALSGAAAALTGAATAHTGAAAAHGGAAAALTAAAGAISGAGGSVGIEKPQWVPLAVEDVAPIDVENVPDSVAIEEPSDNYPLESPSGAYPLAEPGGPYPVAEPTEPYPVEVTKPEWVPLEVRLSTEPDTGSPAGDPSSGPSSGGGGFIGSIHRDLPGTAIREGLVERGSDALSNEDISRDDVVLPGVGRIGGDSAGGTTGTKSTEISESVEYTDRSSTEVIVETNVSDVVDDTISTLEDEYGSRLDEIESQLDALKKELEAVRGRAP